MTALPPIGYARGPTPCAPARRAHADRVDAVNIRWLTSFGGSRGWVVVRPERMVLVTDGRYAERAAADLAAAGLDAEVVAATTRPSCANCSSTAPVTGPVAGRGHAPHPRRLDRSANDLDLLPDDRTTPACAA